MQVSVRTLFEEGKILSDGAIRAQAPLVGWLIYERVDYGGYRVAMRAALVDDEGRQLAELERASIQEVRGRRGLLLVGIAYRKKGRKHSIADRQAWWCHAPPKLRQVDRLAAWHCTWRASLWRAPAVPWVH